MADDYVRVPEDSTGKKLQTHKNTIGANEVHAEAVVIVDSAGAVVGVALEAGGNLAIIAGDTTSLDGKITKCDTDTVTISAALPAGSNNIGDVDIASALPAGSNAIGKLAANDDVDIGDVDVTSVIDTQSSLDHGSNLDVDTSAEQITTTSFNAKRGVVVKADSANTGIVYIGNSDVTAGNTAATDGIPLSAGESAEIEIDNPNKLYAIASVVNQKVYWMAI